METEKKIISIIVGRMASRRFPRKMEQSLCGVPLLEFVINRAKKAFQSVPVVVATSADSIDDRIQDIAKKNNVNCFRGDLLDVAGRLLNCAVQYGADYFVRVNGDSPLIDTHLVSKGLDICRSNDYDVITNIYERSYPYGVSIEIIKTSVFKDAYSQMNETQREHPTSYFYQNSDRFSIFNIKNEIEFNKDMAFAVDMPIHLENLNKLLKDDISKTWRDLV